MLTTMLRSAFPDFKATIDDIIAEGDKLVIRQTWSGTQKGEFMGIPPTGRSVSFRVIDIVRFSGGKFVATLGLDGQHEFDAAAWRSPRSRTGCRLKSQPELQAQRLAHQHSCRQSCRLGALLSLDPGW